MSLLRDGDRGLCNDLGCLLSITTGHQTALLGCLGHRACCLDRLAGGAAGHEAALGRLLGHRALAHCHLGPVA